jgi:hypothetical protein
MVQPNNPHKVRCRQPNKISPHRQCSPKTGRPSKKVLILRLLGSTMSTLNQIPEKVPLSMGIRIDKKPVPPEPRA